jgi:hypothetical protein
MQIQILSGALPPRLRITRRTFAYLEDTATGKIIPAILRTETGKAPSDDEIYGHLRQLGYRPHSEGFELDPNNPSVVPSIN